MTRDEVVAILIGLYLIASIAHLYNLLTGRMVSFYLGILSLVTAFCLHTVMLAIVFLAPGPPSWAPWLDAMAWAIVFLYLMAYLRYREMALGGFAVPAAFILVGYASASPGVWGAGSPEVQGYLLTGHAMLAMMSFGSFFLLFAGSLMYIIQAQQLKSRRPGAWLHRLPPLNVLDDLNHKILYFGFAFLSTGLLLGSMWARSKSGSFWTLDTARTWPLFLTWAGYGVLLVCRVTRSWKGMWSAVFSMAAFVAVVFALAVHL